MDEMKLKNNIAKNITAYRKRCNLTQAQLAEKINYSDKAVSKWERGDGIPDTLVMLKLCEIFDVTLNDLVADKVKKKAPVFLRNKVIITILSSLLVWLVATVVFVLLDFIMPQAEYAWLAYIMALPVMFIVLVVFASIWGNKILRLLSISCLIWTLCVAIYVPFNIFSDGGRPWLIFIIGIPVQILFIVFSLLKKKQTNL